MLRQFLNYSFNVIIKVSHFNRYLKPFDFVQIKFKYVDLFENATRHLIQI